MEKREQDLQDPRTGGWMKKKEEEGEEGEDISPLLHRKYVADGGESRFSQVKSCCQKCSNFFRCFCAKIRNQTKQRQAKIEKKKKSG